MKKITTIKLLAIGVIVMGFVHIAATFSPMIADKLALLSEGMYWVAASYICCVEKQRNIPSCTRLSS